MKKNYITPDLEISKLFSADAITLSIETDKEFGEDDTSPDIF